MSEDEIDDREEVPNDVLASGQLQCAACGKRTEAARAVEEGARPKLHDRSMCWTCGAVSIYHRTSFGYWTLRAPDDVERAEIDANDGVQRARAELAAAKRAGLGPSSVGHDAGGAPPPAVPLVVLPGDPVSWDDLAERHGLDAQTVRDLQRWAVRHVHRSGPGSLTVDCAACETRVRVSVEGQQMIFTAGARVLCPACVHLVQQRFAEGS